MTDVRLGTYEAAVKEIIALRAQVAERADEHNYYEGLLNSKDARIAELEQLLLGEQKLGDWLAAANDDIGERLEAAEARIVELEAAIAKALEWQGTFPGQAKLRATLGKGK